MTKTEPLTLTDDNFCILINWTIKIRLKGQTRSIVVIQVNIFQTELIVEIYSKSLGRAIGEVLLIKLS